MRLPLPSTPLTRARTGAPTTRSASAGGVVVALALAGSLLAPVAPVAAAQARTSITVGSPTTPPATPPATRAANPASPASAVAGGSAAAPRKISYRQWSGRRLRQGTLRGVRVRRGAVRLAPGATSSRARDAGLDGAGVGEAGYQRGSWTSPWQSTSFALTELIASWSARTPRRSLITVEVRGRDPRGRTSSWDSLARWASGDRHVARRTESGQSDDLARVNVDTWQATNGGLGAYQLRVTLLRPSTQRSSPTVDTVGAVASRLPDTTPTTSRPWGSGHRVLDVPRYSQMIHRGHFPQWGNGGQAWCSPTSTSMVLGYYDALPRARAWSWVPGGHTDPWVDLAARRTYDHAYRGTGNWPFNTAYAGTRVGRQGGAFVTRLKNARQAERFIAAGIPLVASISFGTGELSGAPISGTNGHLVVIVGFTRHGDVIVNDPAASSRSGVRRTYDRGQFERVWLRRSGGLVYVIRDGEHRLPRGSAPNW